MGTAVLFALLARLARRPVPLFGAIATVVLLLSFVPNVLLLVNPEPVVPGTTPALVLALVLMHLVSFAITVPTLTGLASGARRVV